MKMQSKLCKGYLLDCDPDVMGPTLMPKREAAEWAEIDYNAEVEARLAAKNELTGRSARDYALYAQVVAGERRPEALVAELKARVDEDLHWLLVKRPHMQHLGDELQDESDRAVLKICNRFSKKHSPVKYVCAYVKKAVIQAIEEHCTFLAVALGPKHRAALRKLKSGMPTGATSVVRLDEEIVFSDGSEGSRRSLLVDAKAAVRERSESTVDLALKCCTNLIERAIVKLRCQGFNDTEIGKEIGLSTAEINKRRRELFARCESSLAISGIVADSD